MSEPMTAAIEWMARNGPPNWVFIVAVLTRPMAWSRYIMQLVEKRLGIRDE